MGKAKAVGWAFVSMVASLGCGQTANGDGNTVGIDHCGQVEPCGGNIAGTWNVVTACENSAALASELSTDCPGATLSVSDLQVSGSYTFGPDSTFSSTVTESGTVNLSIPVSCTNSQTCAELNATALNGIVDMGSESENCTGSSVCTCTIVVSNAVASARGTYEVSGTNVTLTSNADGGTVNEFMYGYCVQGGTTLHLVGVVTAAVNMGPMGPATILSDIVAEKQ